MHYSEFQELLSAVKTVDDLLALNELLEIHNHVSSIPFLLSTPNFNMATRNHNDVINTHVGQSELAALQCELFAAAREALASARESGTIPSSLITSCHQIVKDAGMRPDVDGIGEPEKANGVVAPQQSPFNANWLADAQDLIDDLDLDQNI